MWGGVGGGGGGYGGAGRGGGEGPDGAADDVLLVEPALVCAAAAAAAAHQPGYSLPLRPLCPAPLPCLRVMSPRREPQSLQRPPPRTQRG